MTYEYALAECRYVLWILLELLLEVIGVSDCESDSYSWSQVNKYYGKCGS